MSARACGHDDVIYGVGPDVMFMWIYISTPELPKCDLHTCTYWCNLRVDRVRCSINDVPHTIYITHWHPLSHTCAHAPFSRVGTRHHWDGLVSSRRQKSYDVIPVKIHGVSVVTRVTLEKLYAGTRIRPRCSVRRSSPPIQNNQSTGSTEKTKYSLHEVFVCLVGLYGLSTSMVFQRIHDV